MRFIKVYQVTYEADYPEWLCAENLSLILTHNVANIISIIDLSNNLTADNLPIAGTQF